MRASCSASATVAFSESSSISFVDAAPRFLSIQTVTPTLTFSRAPLVVNAFEAKRR